MRVPEDLCFYQTHQAPALFPAILRGFGVDGARPRAYIGGGPHLPNEVLSFWKE